MEPQIVVLDFGGQYCHLISRRVRDLGIYAEVVPCGFSAAALREKFPSLRGLILSGGPASVGEQKAPTLDPAILEMQLPVLALCYGHQLVAALLGGRIGVGKYGEYGTTDFTIADNGKLFAGLDSQQQVWMNHRDSVIVLPEGFVSLGSTATGEYTAYGNHEKRIYGLQFHPEVSHTSCGKTIFSNFLFSICGCSRDWNISQHIEEKVLEAKKIIGDRKAIVGLSGGIDSCTAAVLVARAIGRQLTAVYVDTGFMRKDETAFISETFHNLFSLRIIDAKKEFFEALHGVVNPEEKRKIIGKLFIEVFERIAREIHAETLVQGTIYPDRIESGAHQQSIVIKSHHNVGGLPKHLNLMLYEPLRDLYKDEVRVVAHALGLPKALINRHPFPGPGLAVRIIGACTAESVDILQRADLILQDELQKSKWHERVWQAFAVLLPIQSVGVQGDARSYKRVIAIRIVDSVDGMTAEFSKIPLKLLERISTRITNEVNEIGRVVYDVTNKPPGTIEWE